MPKVLIIIPTYNEIENIKAVIEAVFINIKNVHILVVDGFSTDGTPAIVEEIQKGNPNCVHLIRQNRKSGLAIAYITGFQWAMNEGYEFICQLDADLSHNPVYLLPMLEILKKGEIDFIVGSRSIEGGGVIGWSYFRHLISRGGSLYTKRLLHIPIKDMTGGFNFWNRKVLESMPFEDFISIGYSIQIEMKTRAYRMNYHFKEFPIIFREREKGNSKMSLAVFMEAIVVVWILRKTRK